MTSRTTTATEDPTDSRSTPLAQPSGHPSTTIRTLSTIDARTAERFYALYVETFGELAVRAVNRHLLRRDEFMAMMVDPRIDKIVIEEESTGEVIAMCTLTNHLEVVDWISPDYFAHHYPDHWARGAVYYLGFSLVSSPRRRVQLFSELITHVSRTLLAKDAMCSYDICTFNNEMIGLGDAVESIVKRAVPQAEVRAVDTQTYYTAVPIHAEDGLRMPSQRSTL